MTAYYLSSHNTVSDTAGKHHYVNLNEAVRAFHSVRKLNMKNMYYTLTRGHQTVILDSRDITSMDGFPVSFSDE